MNLSGSNSKPSKKVLKVAAATAAAACAVPVEIVWIGLMTFSLFVFISPLLEKMTG